MRRFHLVEIEDTRWCPAAIRDGATDYLQFVMATLEPYDRIAPELGDAIERAGATHVVDLCSGAGGPWPALLPLINARRTTPLTVTLTDRFPNLPAWRHVREQSNGLIDFEPEPVDALNVPARLAGFRTMFTGFHHFEPNSANRLLENAARAGEGIGIFELTSRNLAPVVGMLLVPLAIALVTPAFQPFRWSRLFWTYLVPAIPFVGLFDGMVSCLRTYTVHELREMTGRIPGHRWEIGQRKVRLIESPVTYAIGIPDQTTGTGT